MLQNTHAKRRIMDTVQKPISLYHVHNAPFALELLENPADSKISDGASRATCTMKRSTYRLHEDSELTAHL
jgi:hypothetical protein